MFKSIFSGLRTIRVIQKRLDSLEHRHNELVKSVLSLKNLCKENTDITGTNRVNISKIIYCLQMIADRLEADLKEVADGIQAGEKTEG